ncbi:MAG TPA: hypothetical protein VF995_07545 [Actinomycetota bacterium]
MPDPNATPPATTTLDPAAKSLLQAICQLDELTSGHAVARSIAFAQVAGAAAAVLRQDAALRHAAHAVWEGVASFTADGRNRYLLEGDP